MFLLHIVVEVGFACRIYCLLFVCLFHSYDRCTVGISLPRPRIVLVHVPALTLRCTVHVICTAAVGGVSRPASLACLWTCLAAQIPPSFPKGKIFLGSRDWGRLSWRQTIQGPLDIFNSTAPVFVTTTPHSWSH